MAQSVLFEPTVKIGDSIGAGKINAILYADASGKLAQDQFFTFTNVGGHGREIAVESVSLALPTAPSVPNLQLALEDNHILAVRTRDFSPTTVHVTGSAENFTSISNDGTNGDIRAVGGQLNASSNTEFHNSIKANGETGVSNDIVVAGTTTITVTDGLITGFV